MLERINFSGRNNATNENLWIASLDNSLLYKTSFQIIMYILYGLVGLFSCIGNAIIIYVVYTKPDLRSSATNLLITNLAVADLAVTSLALWIKPVTSFQLPGEWMFDENVCYAAAFLPCMAVLIASFTLASIALDRYILIVHPFLTSMRPLSCALVILLIWFLSIGIAFPLVHHTEFRRIPPHFQFCLESSWSPTWSRVLYGTALLVLKSLAPFGLIAFCYSRIAQSLRQIETRLKGRKSSLRELSEIQRKQALQRVLVAMVVIFGLCSLPQDVLNLASDIIHTYAPLDEKNQGRLELARVFCHLLDMSAILWNPLLYAYWNENFKRELPSFSICSRSTAAYRSLANFRTNFPEMAVDTRDLNGRAELHNDGDQNLVVHSQKDYSESDRRWSNTTTRTAVFSSQVPTDRESPEHAHLASQEENIFL